VKQKEKAKRPGCQPNIPRVPAVSVRRREELEAAAALDAICAARPLRPPPLRRVLTTRSAGARELAAEIRRGSYTP